MRYTETKPTAPGWYWWKPDVNSDDDDDEGVYQVIDDGIEDNNYLVVVTPREIYSLCVCDGLWSDAPVPKPEDSP